MSAAPQTEAEALASTLAAEHAAVYLYGLLGARTSEGAEPELSAALDAAYAAHRDRRDGLLGELGSLGETPSAAAPAYTAPTGLDTSDGRTAAALAIEQACAVTYAALVAATPPERRPAAIGYLDDAAVRELSFRGTPEIFPGADELTDR